MEQEIWKDVPGYEGLYQVSNFGNVKSLNYNHTGKERLLKPFLVGPLRAQYLAVGLYKDGKVKTLKTHQLVAMVFLGHIPKGFETVVNHIDNNKLNNNVDNLELVSSRYNSSCHRTDVGVYWHERDSKWKAQIHIRKIIHLGYFTDKQDALDMYQKALANQHLYNGDNKAFRLALADILL